MVTHLGVLCKTKFRHRVELTFLFNGSGKCPNFPLAKQKQSIYNTNVDISTAGMAQLAERRIRNA